jgi:hypothetical protein
VKVVERQYGASEALAALQRSVGHATVTLRRVVEGARSVLETPSISPAGEGAPIGETVSRLLARLELPLDRWNLDRVDPTARVELEQGTFDRLLEPLLLNAHQHGATDQPIVVAAQRVDGTVTIEIANGGTLPFPSLDRLEPFEHRSSGGLGVGVILARRLAQIANAEFDLRQDGPTVRARLSLPAARGRMLGA